MARFEGGDLSQSSGTRRGCFCRVCFRAAGVVTVQSLQPPGNGQRVCPAPLDSIDSILAAAHYSQLVPAAVSCQHCGLAARQQRMKALHA